MIKIALIIPKDTVKTGKLAVDKFEEQIDIFQSSIDKGIEFAKKLEEKGYDAIIARGATEILISQHDFNIPITLIPITPMDVHYAVKELNKIYTIDKEVSLIVSRNMINACNNYIGISGNNIRMFQIKDELDIEKVIKDILKITNSDKNIIIGEGIVSQYAEKYNVRSIVIKSGLESFVEAIADTINIVKAIRKEKKANKRFKAIIDYSYQGIISINEKSDILVFNYFAQELFKFGRDEVLGKKIYDILPELKLEDTLISGIKETKTIVDIKESKYIVSKIPIIVNDSIINAVAILREVEEIQKIEEKIRKNIIATGHFAKYKFNDIIGISKLNSEMLRVAKTFARVDSTILIEGETGTGKEILAQSIHNYSNRQKMPFVAINCAALPESLLESELFGYEPSSFTGADPKGKRGLFELAHKGTIFLDEISEMSPILQGKLLRVIQEKEVMKIGSSNVIPIDIRVIAATNQRLIEEVNFGKFRKDLFYRINVLKIVIPPLREKKEDIEYLLEYFMGKYCTELKKEYISFSYEAKKYLIEYSWPGNIRELKNFCERMVVLTRDKIITLKDVNNSIIGLDNRKNMRINNFKNQNIIDENILNIEDMQKLYIEMALKNSNGKIVDAADMLGISRTTLWRKMKKYNIIVSKWNDWNAMVNIETLMKH